VNCGRHSVVIGNVYRGAPAEDVSYLLGRLCEWLDGPDFQAPEGSVIGMETVEFFQNSLDQ